MIYFQGSQGTVQTADFSWTKHVSTNCACCACRSCTGTMPQQSHNFNIQTAVFDAFQLCLTPGLENLRFDLFRI